VDFTYYQANSKSEDMQGDNFFHIRTQQYALDYTRSWDIKEYLAAFVTAGAGGFRAEPMEVNHVDRSGWSGFIGGGLEIMPESRSSLRLGVGRARVRMDDGKADNFYFTLSSVWYVGVGKPSPSSPPPAAPPG
jgi:hypothetical protein